MRKKDESLREKLLVLAKQMADENGPESINIRELASRANVASGTVYNYFANKEEILLALTEGYWKNLLEKMYVGIHADSFPEQICEVYDFLRSEISRSAGTLMGSLRKAESVGRERMQEMQSKLRQNILIWMDADDKISSEVWDTQFTKEKFADFVMLNVMALLNARAPNALFLSEIIKKTLY